MEPRALLRPLERSDTVTKLAAPVQRLVRPLARQPALTNILSGKLLGHPLHPALVSIPGGCWTAASILDIGGRTPAAARRLVGIGVAAAVPTALAGAHDWTDTEGAEQRVGMLHAACNLGATVCYAASWRARRRGGRAGVPLGWTGAALASLAAWLGGHMSYGLGVGVDTNAFDSGPEEWQSVDLAEPGEGQLMAVPVPGARLAMVSNRGRLHALADRCSHRGGPLSQGAIDGDCVTCPWHGSQFDLQDGAVKRGPASVAQPTYEVRRRPDGVQVRRPEARALRANSVAPSSR